MYNNAHRRRVGVGQSLLLRQPARERRRRPRRALGARVARMLSAESRAVPRVDAGLHLRAGHARRDLRQPLRLERRRRSTSHGEQLALARRERDAVGRTHRRSRLDDGDGRRPRSSCAFPGWARNRPAPGGLYRYADASTKHAGGVGQRQTRQRRARRDRLRHARPRLDRRRRDRRSSLPVEPRRVVADDRVRGRSAARWRSSADRSSTARNGPTCDGGRALDLLVDRDGAADAVASTTALSAASPSSTRRRARLTNPSAPRGAGRADSVPPVGQSRRRRDDASGCSTRELRDRRRRPRRRLHLLREPELRGRRLALSRGGAVRSERGREVGLLPPAIAGARGTGDRHRASRTPRDMLAACAERGSAARLCAPASRVNGVGGWFLPSRDELALMYRNLKAAGARRLSRRRRCRQRQLLGVVAADRRHGGRTSTSPTSAAQHGDDKDFPRRVRAVRMI